MSEGYAASVAHALKSPKLAMPLMGDQLWLAREVLLAAPTMVSVRAPYEVVCVTDARLDADYMRRDSTVMFKALALRGWGLEISAMMFRNFRMFHPAARFDPELHAVMNRQALIAEYGSTFGNLFADINADPGCQPIFEQLLSNELDVMVSRAPCMLAARVTLDGSTLSRSSDWRAALNSVEVFPLVEGCELGHNGPPTILSYTRAAQTYREHTGLDLLFTTDLDPRTNDYEKIAATGEALRDADRPG
jgi:hypothetical protein